MAETFKFNHDAVTKKIEAVLKAQIAVQGKRGYNPFFYINNAVTPLQKRLAKGETTEALYKEIMALNEIPKAISATDAEPSANKIMGNPESKATIDKPTAPSGLKITEK